MVVTVTVEVEVITVGLEMAGVVVTHVWTMLVA